jgi:hypothetical protein
MVGRDIFISVILLLPLFMFLKGVTSRQEQFPLIVLGLLDRNCLVLCLLQNTTSGYTTFTIQVMLRSHNAVQLMSKKS